MKQFKHTHSYFDTYDFPPSFIYKYNCACLEKTGYRPVAIYFTSAEANQEVCYVESPTPDALNKTFIVLLQDMIEKDLCEVEKLLL